MPTYTFKVSNDVKAIEIDTTKLMADMNGDNNVFEIE
jgi:hypothetical protein